MMTSTTINSISVKPRRRLAMAQRRPLAKKLVMLLSPESVPSYWAP